MPEQAVERKLVAILAADEVAPKCELGLAGYLLGPVVTAVADEPEGQVAIRRMPALGVSSFLRSDLTLPLSRATPYGVSLFGPTLFCPPMGCMGTRDMKRGRQYGVAVSLLLACIVLVACADEPVRPAPVFLNGGPPGMVATRSAAAKATTPDTRSVIVGPGQSLGRIAEANHLSKQAIIAANHLSSPYKLKIGQVLKIPVATMATTPTRGKTVAASPAHSGRPTILAGTQSAAKGKRVASEELIPLDDPISSAETPKPPLSPKGSN
ncbi:MAG: LysM peptidoglycan-binding domain-containing protein [Deltaproteobacteria bacterium]|nr:LysM peptidoglycan-binding domain-containing protein [Deltaproteobacteria bacterium]